MQLDLLAPPLAIVRLAPDADVPVWADRGPLTSVTRTPSELSVVCAQEHVPPEVECERGWRALVVAGPLDFSLTGVLAALAQPLAEAEVPIFALSTYDTDYVLVREPQLDAAIEALAAAGHEVS